MRRRGKILAHPQVSLRLVSLHCVIRFLKNSEEEKNESDISWRVASPIRFVKSRKRETANGVCMHFKQVECRNVIAVHRFCCCNKLSASRDRNRFSSLPPSVVTKLLALSVSHVRWALLISWILFTQNGHEKKWRKVKMLRCIAMHEKPNKHREAWTKTSFQQRERNIFVSTEKESFVFSLVPFEKATLDKCFLQLYLDRRGLEVCNSRLKTKVSLDRSDCFENFTQRQFQSEWKDFGSVDWKRLIEWSEWFFCAVEDYEFFCRWHWDKNCKVEFRIRCSSLNRNLKRLTEGLRFTRDFVSCSA